MRRSYIAGVILNQERLPAQMKLSSKGDKLKGKCFIKVEKIKVIHWWLVSADHLLYLHFHCPHLLWWRWCLCPSPVKAHYLPAVTLLPSASIILACHFVWDGRSQSDAWLHPEEPETANRLSEIRMSPPLRVMSSPKDEETSELHQGTDVEISQHGFRRFPHLTGTQRWFFFLGFWDHFVIKEDGKRRKKASNFFIFLFPSLMLT